MAYFQLNSLLHGPVVQVLLDEKRDGCFDLICHDQPLLMLTYFSSTIREEFPANHPLLSNSISTQWPPHPQQAPVAVRLIGGSSGATKDLIDWMSACCHQNSLIPLRAVIPCPAKYILAMDGIQRLGIELLKDEIAQLQTRLRHELFEVDTVREIFAAGHNLLPEIATAICHCVARYFFHGSLPEIDKWMHLATMNLKFDDGVKAWLRPGAMNEGSDVVDAYGLWNSKGALTYPARWYQPSSAGPSFERLRPRSSNPLPSQIQPPTWNDDLWPRNQPGRSASYNHSTGCPLPPPRPEAYRSRTNSHVLAYTVRCSYCQQIYSEVGGTPHRCTTSHAYTIPSTPSPPPRGRSRSHHRRPSYVEEHYRSPSPYRVDSQRPPGGADHGWDASYEPPEPGEYLRERRQLGPGHFVHFFVDQYGRERVVTKGGDVSVEGSRLF